MAAIVFISFITPRTTVAQKTPPAQRGAQTSRPSSGASKDDAETAEFRRQLGELARLSTTQKIKLASTVDLIERVTKKVQLTDFPEHFMEGEIFPGDGYKAKRAVEECREFLADGLMREALSGSLEALYDAWAVDLAFKSQVVLDATLGIIKKYRLEGDSLYVMSREILKVSYNRVRLAVRMLELANKEK